MAGLVCTLCLFDIALCLWFGSWPNSARTEQSNRIAKRAAHQLGRSNRRLISSLRHTSTWESLFVQRLACQWSLLRAIWSNRLLCETHLHERSSAKDRNRAYPLIRVKIKLEIKIKFRKTIHVYFGGFQQELVAFLLAFRRFVRFRSFTTSTNIQLLF